jgi:hypothetical protein
MTKTKLLGGILLGIAMVLGTTAPASAMVLPTEQGYAKSYAQPATEKVVVKASAEYRAANSPKAKDRMGYMPSLYKGKWYDKRYEDSRKCIMSRESHFNYRAANRSSSARGAYQFLENSWHRPLVYMMLKESKQTNDGLRKDIKELFNKPIAQWSRYFQDRAFFTAWQHGKGKHHWYYPGHRCY